MKRLALVALMSLSACTGVDTVGHPDAKYVTKELAERLRQEAEDGD